MARRERRQLCVDMARQMHPSQTEARIGLKLPAGQPGRFLNIYQ